MVRVMVDEELNSDLMAPRHARQRVREQLGGAACEDDAVLVASELVTNAVSHGVPPIRLGLRLLPHCVRLEVHDGAGLVHARQSDSRGLAVVASVSRSWGISRTRVGKVVWAEIDHDALH